MTLVVLVAIIAAQENSYAAMRVVSLKPSVTDVFVEMRREDMLVGVTKYCEFSSKNKVEIVGDYTRPFIERIIALHPDLVIGSMENSSRRSIERLRELGIRVEMLPFVNMGESIDSVRAIGKLVGEENGAEKVALRMEKELSDAKQRAASNKKSRVLVVWGKEPIVVAGSGTYMDELLLLVGAANAFGKGSAPYPHIGLEKIVELNPDVILDLSMGSEKDTGAAPWSNLKSVNAVKNKKIRALDASLFRAGPHATKNLKLLAEAVSM